MVANEARLPAPLQETVEFVVSWLEHDSIIEMMNPRLNLEVVTIMFLLYSDVVSVLWRARSIQIGPALLSHRGEMISSL